MKNTISAPKIEIPIVDLSAMWGSNEEISELSESLREICHEIGFFVVCNHGIDSDIIDQAFRFSQRFFKLPLEQKQLIDKRNSRFFRGWEGEGAESTNNRTDFREQIDIWTDHNPVEVVDQMYYLNLLGPNQWLDEEKLPGFRAAIEQYIAEVGSLGDRLLGLLAVGLKLPIDYFEKYFGTERMSLTKLIRYPQTPESEFGVNAHHDQGFLTILNPGHTPGLEIQMSDESWTPVPIIEDAFVINLGEMLQAITGNYYLATPHRVTATCERYSIGYFHGPSLDTSIERIPLPTQYAKAVSASSRHLNAGYMAPIKETKAGVGDMKGNLRATTYGEQLWQYFCRSYPDNVRHYYPSLVE